VEMQEKCTAYDKRAYSRPSVVGFFIKNPPIEMGNPISFINTSITRTKHYLSIYRVREVHFIVFETTTAMRIRITEQQYISGWSRMIQDILAEAIQLLGEDTVLDLSDATSENVKRMFKDMERDADKKKLIHSFQVHCIILYLIKRLEVYVVFTKFKLL
jgi:hypothetical protein